jgi:hypothetical protein
MRFFLLVHGSFEECFYRVVRNVGHRRKRVHEISQEILYIGYVGRPFQLRLGDFMTVVPQQS